MFLALFVARIDVWTPMLRLEADIVAIRPSEPRPAYGSVIVAFWVNFDSRGNWREFLHKGRGARLRDLVQMTEASIPRIPCRELNSGPAGEPLIQPNNPF